MDWVLKSTIVWHCPESVAFLNVRGVACHRSDELHSFTRSLRKSPSTEPLDAKAHCPDQLLASRVCWPDLLA